MTKKTEEIMPCPEYCPVRRTLALLGGKWTLLILYQINDRVVRFGALRRTIPGISEKMLIQELNVLIENKMVLKKSYPQIPPKVEYQLTDLGMRTLPIVDALAIFGLENLPDI